LDAAVEPFKARRIYLLLRSQLTNGQLAPGLQLPSEPELAAEHGVSRVTVRRALGQLAEEGLIERRPGAGTFARDTGMARPIVVDLANVFFHLLEMGRETSVRLLSFNYVTPPPAIAAALRLPSGERVQRAVRVRLMDGAPFSYLTTHVPERVGLTYSEADLGTTPLLRLLEDTGVVATRASQTISATLAEPDAAKALQLEIGSPLLSLTRVVYDTAGSGVEHLHALYRPDRYSFQMDLERDGAARERRWNPVQPRAASKAKMKRPGKAIGSNTSGLKTSGSRRRRHP
jgi:GntR family transcriptional regulator